MTEEQQHYVSRIKLDDGTIINIKDSEARLLLESLFADEIILDCGSAYTQAEE